MTAHIADAVREHLVQLHAPDPVYDADVPTSTQGQPRSSRYVVLWADPGRRHSEDVAGAMRDVVARFRVHHVGVSAQEVRHLSWRTQSGMALWAPPVDGMALGRVEHESTEYPERQDQMPTPLFMIRDRFVVRGYRLA